MRDVERGRVGDGLPTGIDERSVLGAERIDDPLDYVEPGLGELGDRVTAGRPPKPVAVLLDLDQATEHDLSDLALLGDSPSRTLSPWRDSAVLAFVPARNCSYSARPRWMQA